MRSYAQSKKKHTGSYEHIRLIMEKNGCRQWRGIKQGLKIENTYKNRKES